jgi:hypothetical protein
MYPREIRTTSIWIRHNLPLYPSPPPNGDEKLRNQIRFQNVKLTDEMIERSVRQEFTRLDRKWCLDQYFGWNVSDPFLGQLVTANLFRLVHLAYVIDISHVNITVIPVDMFGNCVPVGLDDIYSAEDGPFFENILLNHRFLHSQHVLDYVANQKRQDDLLRFNHNLTFGVDIIEAIYENSESKWLEGGELWFIHDVLPRRDQFVTCKQQIMLTISTFKIVENLVQETSSV